MATSSPRATGAPSWSPAIQKATAVTLVVSTRRNAGSVTVFVGKKRFKTFSLQGKNRVNRLRTVVLDKPRSGKVRIVVGKDEPVRIEGVAVVTSRRGPPHERGEGAALDLDAGSGLEAGAMTVTPAIEIVGLTKSYGDHAVLRGVDLSVPSGTVVALLGSNGAGKTTLVRILSTLLGADLGTASVHGHDVGAQPPGA